MIDKVIVITINYKQNQDTLECINSLLKSDYANFKILLIDNRSTEENVDDLEKRMPPDKRILFHKISPNRGYVGGINYGLKEGTKLRPDYFLIMNNDTIIEKNAIAELVKTCNDYDNKAIVTGKEYDYNEPSKLRDVGSTFKNKKLLSFNGIVHNEVDKGQYDNIEERDLIDDVFWLMPLNLYEKIGGYSPYFWFNSEQADFAFRAKREGYKLIYTHKAKLWHKGSISIGGRDYNPKLCYWTVQSSLILKFIHLNKIYFLIFYFNTIISIIATFMKSLYFKVNSKQNIFIYAKAKYLGWMYFNKWFFKRHDNNGYNPFN